MDFFCWIFNYLMLLSILFFNFLTLKTSAQETSLDSGLKSNKSEVDGAPSSYGVNLEDVVETNQAAEKVSFNIQILESPLNDLTWCTTKKGKTVALGVTNKGIVYKSTNHGLKWESMEKDFKYSGEEVLERDKDDIGKIVKVIKSPLEANLVIFLGSNYINWLSEDCGDDLLSWNNGRKVIDFKLHPTDRNLLLASAWTKCDDFDAAEDCAIYKELFLSKDLGRTWKSILNYVAVFDWGLEGSEYVDLGVPANRIIAAYEPKGQGHQEEKGWSTKLQVRVSDNFFKTSKLLVDKGNRFLIVKGMVFVAKAEKGNKEQDVSLMIANAMSKNLKFEKVSLPVKHLNKNGFTILSSSQDAQIIHVNHFGANSPFGNIYVSNQERNNYSLSLLNNVRNKDGNCDFEKVEGLSGIYIANIVDSSYVKQIEDLLIENSQQIQSETSGKNSETKSSKEEKMISQFQNFVKSKITFDNGGIWEDIKPPKLDIFGKPFKCEGECSLQLNAYNFLEYGPVYSQKNALGLIMGTGNVGEFISRREDEISTFLSRDAGQTWEEVAKGSHIYEYGDHGGLIVMASNSKATDIIKFSYNEGRTWSVIKLNRKIDIINIVTEPDNTCVHFLVLGLHYNDTTGYEGVVISLDFKKVLSEECGDSNDYLKPESNYELWFPFKKSRCLLGQRRGYVKRKPDAKCFNGEDFERVAVHEACDCTEDDWECDIGYFREKNGPCTREKRVNETDYIDYKPPANCKDFFEISSGYRRIPNTACRGGVNYPKTKIPCPSKILGGKSSEGAKRLQFTLRNLVVVAVIVLIAICWIKRDEILSFGRDKIPMQRPLAAVKNFMSNEEKRTNYEKFDENKGVDNLEAMIEEKEEQDDEEAGDAAVEIQEEEHTTKPIAKRGGVETANKKVPKLGGRKQGEANKNLIEDEDFV